MLPFCVLTCHDSCFRSHSHDERDTASRSHRVPGYGLQVWEHPIHRLPLAWSIKQVLGKLESFWSKYFNLLIIRSLLADITSPQLPPTTLDAKREATHGRLTGATGRVTPTLPRHTEWTGSRKLPRLQKSATKDRGTTCPSKKSQKSSLGLVFTDLRLLPLIPDVWCFVQCV